MIEVTEKSFEYVRSSAGLISQILYRAYSSEETDQKSRCDARLLAWAPFGDLAQPYVFEQSWRGEGSDLDCVTRLEKAVRVHPLTVCGTDRLLTGYGKRVVINPMLARDGSGLDVDLIRAVLDFCNQIRADICRHPLGAKESLRAAMTWRASDTVEALLRIRAEIRNESEGIQPERKDK